MIEEAVFDGRGDDANGFARFGQRAMGGDGQGGCAVAQRREPIAEVIDFPFGKDRQRPTRSLDDFDPGLECGETGSVAVDREDSQPGKQPIPETPIPFEQLVSRHRRERLAAGAGDLHQGEPVRAIAMIERDDDPVAAGLSLAEAFDSLDFDRLDPMILAQHAPSEWSRRPYPKRRKLRRDEAIGQLVGLLESVHRFPLLVHRGADALRLARRTRVAEFRSSLR